MGNVLTLAIIVFLAINAGIGYMALKAIERSNTLILLFAPKRPGRRRSGAIIKLPRINYGSGDDESLLDEA